MQRLILEYKIKEKEALMKHSARRIEISPRRHRKGQGRGDNRGKGKEPGLLQKSYIDFFLGHSAMQSMVTSHKWAEEGARSPAVIDTSRVELNEEILHHLIFCREKCKVFCGRNRELGTVMNFLRLTGNTQPFIVYAPSGAGKTAFMAMVAKKSKEWLGQGCVTIVRFMGTSPQSSTIRQVLISVCRQICAAYGEPFDGGNFQKISKLVQYLETLLLMVSVKHGHSRPLVIVLDSVDQLSSADGAHELRWMPTSLPMSIYVLLSMIPTQHSCLEHARLALPEGGNFLELTEISTGVAAKLTQAHLSSRRRTLTNDQLRFLLDKMSANRTPLYMKLLLDTACQWRSSNMVSTLRLLPTVKDAIRGLFERLERKFGKHLCRASLGYLTIGKGGLTEVELEDALSCNNEVLSEVYRFHDPPAGGTLRVPPLIWARIRYDLGDYIIERQEYSKRTVFWYHRQFAQTAKEFFAGGETRRALHADLAEIFLVEDKIQRDITLTYRKYSQRGVDRQVMPQPLTSSNIRKLTSLPYHLLHAGKMGDLKRHCYCNLRFIQCYMDALGISDFVQELTGSLEVEPDGEVLHLRDCFRFCSEEVKVSPAALPVQILGHLLGASPNSALAQLCSQSTALLQNLTSPTLIPILGSMPLSCDICQWYSSGTVAILTCSKDCSHLLVQRSNQPDVLPTCRLLNLDALQVGHPLQIQSTAMDDTLVQCTFRENHSQLFMLCRNTFRIFSVPSGELQQSSSTEVTKGGRLNMLMAVAPVEPLLLLGGADRLAVFEDESTSGVEAAFRLRHVMNFGGATATTNLTFAHCETMSVSTHTVSTEHGAIGALVLWKFNEKTLRMKVPLPSPVEAGFMHLLPPVAGNDIVLCGCTMGQIFIIDIHIGKVIVELGCELPHAARFLTIYDKGSNTLVTAAEGGSHLKVWNTKLGHAGLIRSVPIDLTVLTMASCGNAKHIAVGDRDGMLTLVNIKEKCHYGTVEAHQGAVECILADDRDRLLTCGEDSVLKLWDLEQLVAQTSAAMDKVNMEKRREGTEDSSKSHVSEVESADERTSTDQLEVSEKTPGASSPPELASDNQWQPDPGTNVQMETESIHAACWGPVTSHPGGNTSVFLTSADDDGGQHTDGRPQKLVTGRHCITVQHLTDVQSALCMHHTFCTVVYHYCIPASDLAARVWYADQHRCQVHATLATSEVLEHVLCPTGSQLVAAVTRHTKKLLLFDSDTGDHVPLDGAPAGEVIDLILLDQDSESGVLLVKAQATQTLSIHHCNFTSGTLEKTTSGIADVGKIVPKKSLLVGKGRYVVVLTEIENSKSYKVKAIDTKSGKVVTCHHEVAQLGRTVIEEAMVYSIAKLEDSSVVCGCMGEALIWAPPRELCLSNKKDKMYAWLKHSRRLQMKVSASRSLIQKVQTLKC